jgi:hypothetical protein
VTDNPAILTLDELDALGLLAPVANALCVFVSGSILAGWGHANSDLDLYVVHDEDIELETPTELRLALARPRVPIVIAFAGRLRIDAEYWHAEQIDEILAKVAPETMTGSTAAGADLSSPELDFLYRLGIAKALAGEEWLERARAELAGSAVKAVAATSYFNLADSYIEDSAGLLSTGDLHSAFLAARLALGSTVDGLVAYYGELSPSVKWRARKMRAAEPRELSFERYWELETARGADKAVDEWIRDLVATCQQIMASVDLA